MDPSAASFSTQLFQDGLTPTPADNAVVDAIRLVASLLSEGMLLVHESCAGWIDEIPCYVWDEKAALLGEDKPVKVGDHSLDAGRYAIKTPEVLWRPYVLLTSTWRLDRFVVGARGPAWDYHAMGIAWGTVQTAAATAVFVTLAVEYLAKPLLEARKDRHLEAMRARRRFQQIIFDISISADLYAGLDSDGRRPDVRQKIADDRSRHFQRLVQLDQEIVDNLGKYATAWSPTPFRNDVALFAGTLHGIFMSGLGKQRQAEKAKELAEIAQRIFFATLRSSRDLVRARADLKAFKGPGELSNRSPSN